jgi:hypothetical protein
VWSALRSAQALLMKELLAIESTPAMALVPPIRHLKRIVRSEVVFS